MGENIACNEEINKSIKTNPELTQMLALGYENSYYNCIPYVQKTKYRCGRYVKGQH